MKKSQNIDDCPRHYKELFDDLFQKSIFKIIEIRNKIDTAIYQFFEELVEKIKQQWNREKGLLEEMCTDDILNCFDPVQEQIQQKIEKLQSFLQTIREFKLSPTINIVDPMLKVPLYTDIRLREPTFPKKIRKSKDNTDFLKCPECDEKIELIGSFRLHLNKVHNMVLNFKCPHCEFIHNDYKQMGNHIMENHGLLKQGHKGSSTLSYTCQFTNKEFSSKMLFSYALKHNINYHIYE